MGLDALIHRPARDPDGIWARPARGLLKGEASHRGGPDVPQESQWWSSSRGVPEHAKERKPVSCMHLSGVRFHRAPRHGHMEFADGRGSGAKAQLPRSRRGPAEEEASAGVAHVNCARRKHCRGASHSRSAHSTRSWGTSGRLGFARRHRPGRRWIGGRPCVSPRAPTGHRECSDRRFVDGP